MEIISISLWKKHSEGITKRTGDQAAQQQKQLDADLNVGLYKQVELYCAVCVWCVCV